jgi:large conductance mechanosensitive channel
VSESKGALAGFKEFLMRGNVVELAVAVVVGTAFSKIVNSVVTGLINPLVGAIGGQSLSQYSWCLTDEGCQVDPVTGAMVKGVQISWGAVVGAVITFVITAAVVYFLMILPMNKYKKRQAAKKPAEPVAPAAPTEVELLAQIRDLMVAQRDGHAEDGPAVLTAQRGGAETSTHKQ